MESEQCPFSIGNIILLKEKGGMRESFPRQVDKESRGPQGERVAGAGVRTSTRGKGHEEGGSTYAKAGSSLRSPPGNSRVSTPKNQSLPTLMLCALTSDFTGGCPPPPSHSL